ncbi:MAG: hypothetical protein H6835_01550 [Planctomycetes bacterium]|nr:hypothetical protein [Planctomycetota bacterium]
MSARRATAVVLSVLLLGTGGCGYTFGSGLADAGVRTVAFQVAGNETFRQRYEVDLSHYLARELPITTDLQLADRATADAVLEVTLETIGERTLVNGVRDPVGNDPNFSRVREGLLQGFVRVRLVDRRGNVLVDRRLQDRTEFRSPIGENLTSARNELTEDLARKIALALQSEL